MTQENKQTFKKYLIYSFSFLIAGLVAGVFFREFSKFFGVTNTFTVLGLVHPHILILGTFMFLLFGFVNIKLGLDKNKYMKWFVPTYAVATGLAGMMLLVRGVIDVLLQAGKIETLSSGINGMISGLSGLFHVILGVMIVSIFVLWIISLKGEKKIESESK